MPKAYELRSLLEEILEDEKAADVRGAKLSQTEIERMVREQQDRKAGKKRGPQIRLGETLAQLGLVTPGQIEEALSLQAAKGGRIGSLLVEQGHIGVEQLIAALEIQHGVKGVDLSRTTAGEKAMRLLQLSTMMKHRVIPLRAEDNIIKLAMEDPGNLSAVNDVEFITGMRVEPVVAPSYQMDTALGSLEQNEGRAVFLSKTGSEGPLTIHTVLELFVSSKASDLLVSAGVPPSFRLLGELHRTELPAVSAEQCVAFAKALMTEKQWEQFLCGKELDFALGYPALGRFRVSAYRQRNTISLALRRIPDVIPDRRSLGLPDWLEPLALRPQGLIVFAAPAGHGKTTSLHATIDVINKNRRCNVITLEDPVEYLQTPRKSNINQREIGTDTNTFAEGLKRVLRQAPDVIVVGEMRDGETIETAVGAAASGCLVLSAIHAPNTTSAIDGMLHLVPRHAQARIRQQLSQALVLVLSQRLIPGKKAGALVLAHEKLVNSYRIGNLIREGKEHQIRAQSRQEADDFASLDACLVNLIREGKLTRDEVVPFAENIEHVERAVTRAP
ncbi:MAG: PilT/PilU family type 4a pilus ATPase [Desulfobacteraceae bacterium]|nr:PilT/PilU family type 4a pilus ATPase [Desulfobacteraceae bacterium]